MPSPALTIFFAESTLSSSITLRRRDPGLEEQRVRQLVVARRAVEEHKNCSAARSATPHDVTGGCDGVHDEHELVLVERELLDGGVVEGTRQPDGGLVALHELDHFLGMAGAHGEPDVGVRLGEALEDRRQRVRRDDRRRADRDVAGGAVLQLGSGPRSSLRHRLQRAFRIGEEGAPGLGHAHAAAPADSSGVPDRPLEGVRRSPSAPAASRRARAAAR